MRGMTIPRRALVPPTVRRVILVVTDGLRPDIIPLLELPTFGRLVRQGASTLGGRTVCPSVTAAAMASLMTGVEPPVHGLSSSRFRLPRPALALDPLPGVLRDAGVRAAAFMADIPWGYRRLATLLGNRLGFDAISCRGEGAGDILAAARHDLMTRKDGLIVMHWPDGDRAGHEHGWPSPAYLRAARWMDQCLAELDDVTNASTDPDTLLVVMADHGGGGTTRRDHDSNHPLNRTIPIILAGGAVRRTTLWPDSSLLDVPPTVLHALGVAIPESYAGRVLHEAFSPAAGLAWMQRSSGREGPALAAAC
jgi:arylsulfatase A-like enzyme